MLIAVGLLLVTGWWDVMVDWMRGRGSSPASWRASMTHRPHRRPGRPAPPAAATSRRRCVRVELARWAWRQLTSMRTALILLFLLALACDPRVGDPAGGGRLAACLPVARGPAPEADAGLREARAVLRLQLGVVLRDLHPADASRWSAASCRGCGSTGAAYERQPPKAPRNLGRLPAYRSFETDEDRRRRPRACARRAARKRRYRVRPARPTVAAVSRGARLPARGRQPALPPLGARRAGRLRGRRAVRVQGRRHRGDQGRVRQHAEPVRRLPRRLAVRPGRARRRSTSPSTTST